MQDPAWTDQWIRTLKLTSAATVLSSPLRKCIPKHLNPFHSLLALIYQIFDGWISRIVQLVHRKHCSAWSMHDQFSVSSCRFKPNMQPAISTQKQGFCDSVLYKCINVVLIFSYHVSSSFNCFLLSRLPFTISYGSRVFPKAWTHRAQSFGSHQSAAEMGDRNPSDWLHVQPAMEATWKRGAGFAWDFHIPASDTPEQLYCCIIPLNIWGLLSLATQVTGYQKNC